MREHLLNGRFTGVFEGAFKVLPKPIPVEIL